MDPTAATYTLLRAFAEELARCGMQAACTSPGSRSAPLVLSLAREPGLRCYSHIDERCAGFFALGLAKASARPVAVACTSGTAAAELLPAAIEAREARVPLLLLTADRPAELRENGAGQAIDQLGLYGGAVKWFFEVGVHEAGAAQLRWMRTLACRAYWTALEGRPGAVHLNFPLREPLLSEAPLGPDHSARPDGAPYVARFAPVGAGFTSGQSAAASASVRPQEAQALEQAGLAELLAGALRGVVVAGRHERPTPLGSSAAALAAELGWPLLADPLSGARRGPAAIAHYDALLRDATFAREMRPDLVLRVGDLPVSKPLRSWLEGLEGVPQIALDPEGAWQDPGSVLSHSLALDPTTALATLAALIDRPAGAAREAEAVGAVGAVGAAQEPPGEPGEEEEWLGGWRSADGRAAEAILGQLGGPGLSEPRVAAELGVLLPAEASLFVASSMPVRDIETFWPVRDDPPRVLCNRGANGIDGTVSAAFGAAAADEGRPVVLLIGDVALAYDIGGLLAAGRLGLRLTIVLLDNGGGGIFDFLAVAAASLARAPEGGGDPAGDGEAAARAGTDIYTRHIATPTGLDFSRAAALYGLGHERVEDAAGLRSALERALAGSGSSIVEVRGERVANVELHRRVWAAVSAALSR
jgi:2-succinyl-5-enolpyruvyl-6-hydroxy-3-cyclohexene-1-carboxylate synthase